VIPRMISSACAASPPASITASLVLATPGDRRTDRGAAQVSPFWSTLTFFIIWRTISSMCLSLMSTPWDL